MYKFHKQKDPKSLKPEISNSDLQNTHNLYNTQITELSENLENQSFFENLSNYSFSEGNSLNLSFESI